MTSIVCERRWILGAFTRASSTFVLSLLLSASGCGQDAANQSTNSADERAARTTQAVTEGPSACQTLTCNAAGSCVTNNKPDGTSCDDGNLCTRTDSCVNGSCSGANPVNCGVLDQCHAAGTCAPSTGQCSYPNAADGTACFDANVCSSADVCHGGTCAGSPIASGPLCDGAACRTITRLKGTGLDICAQLAGGRVDCWGGASQLFGSNGSNALLSPAPVPALTNALDWDNSFWHSCAVEADGRVHCWGGNTNGTLGDGTNIDRPEGIYVPGITNATKVVTLAYSTCALLADGTAKCWGNNGWGQLGNGSTLSTNSPVSVGNIGPIADLSTNAVGVYALTTDHHVKYWGSVYNGAYAPNAPNPVAVPGFDGAVQLSLGMDHVCAVMADASVKCAGNNAYGQLGNGSTTSTVTPVTVTGLGPARKVVANYWYSCALLVDGSAACWGFPGHAVLGNGRFNLPPENTSPISVLGISGATDIQRGETFNVCALMNGCSVECWGSEGGMGIGTGALQSPRVPRPALIPTELNSLSITDACVMPGNDDAIFAVRNSASVTVDSPLGRYNHFDDGADHGQPTSFAPGVVLFHAPISEQGSVTWTLGTSSVYVDAQSKPCTVASQHGEADVSLAGATLPGGSLALLDVCRIAAGSDGVTTIDQAVFGYENTGFTTVQTSVGVDNQFSSLNDLGQPREFRPGKGIFSVQLPAGASRTWTLGASVLTASAATPLCPMLNGDAGTEVLLLGATFPYQPPNNPWLEITAHMPDNWPRPGNVALLPDGRVLASGQETANVWYTLTPDEYGSYQNGTWTAVESSAQGRVFNPAFILKDGRYINCGGEYQLDQYEILKHPRMKDRARCEVFDPATDSWTPLPSDMPDSIADAPAVELGDGSILQPSYQPNNIGNQSAYVLNTGGIPTRSLSWTATDGFDTAQLDQEGTCLLLQDGSALCGNIGFRRYIPSNPAGMRWVDAMPSASDPTTDHFGLNNFLPQANDGEVGAFLLLHSGEALILGSNALNALYTPPSAKSPGTGTWHLTENTPLNSSGVQLNHGDSVATVEPDGRVLTGTSTNFFGVGSDLTELLEYTPPSVTPTLPNRWQSVPTPARGGVTLKFDNERMRMLNLPASATSDGAILVTGADDGSAWLYQPSGAPQTAWRPTITGLAGPNAGIFTLSGTQLNGLTTGAMIGDDGLMQTNFPIVSLTDSSGRVSYARTIEVDQMTPRPSTAGWCRFVLPTNIRNGTYQVRVSANGVNSLNAASLTVQGIHVRRLSIAPGGPDTGVSEAAFFTLSSPAPAGGAVVHLSSSDENIATVSPTVTLQQGAIAGAAAVTLRGLGRAIISAHIDVVNNQFQPATAKFGWTLRSFGDANPSASPPPIYYGELETNWTVSLSAASTFPLRVTLANDHPELVTVPPSVTIPAGASSVRVPIGMTVDHGLVSEGLATITAKLANSEISRTIVTGAATNIGGMDFYKCADEGGSCVMGAASSSSPAERFPLRMVAFGSRASGRWSLSAAGGMSTPCSTSALPDPGGSPGARGCFYSSYAFFGEENDQLDTGGALLEVAYGVVDAQNAAFSYRQLSGQFKCDDATFDHFNAAHSQIPTNVPRRCWYGPVGYNQIANRGDVLTLAEPTPLAYGANGHYVYQVMSGRVTCDRTAFNDLRFDDHFYDDPNHCFKVSASYINTAGAPYSSPSGTHLVYYGSGVNGVFMLSGRPSGTCSDSDFGGSPDFGHSKFCWLSP